MSVDRSYAYRRVEQLVRSAKFQASSQQKQQYVLFSVIDNGHLTRNDIDTIYEDYAREQQYMQNHQQNTQQNEYGGKDIAYKSLEKPQKEAWGDWHETHLEVERAERELKDAKEALKEGFGEKSKVEFAKDNLKEKKEQVDRKKRKFLLLVNDEYQPENVL